MTITTRPDTAYFRAVRRAREQFDQQTAEHQMTVPMDQMGENGSGLPYRHIRFARNGTSIWSFNLTTWPGHLAITGDIESFTFRRLHDMFDFFRSDEINPSYWGQKVVAGPRGTDLGRVPYSEEQFVETVRTETGRYELDPEFESLQAAVQTELLDDLPFSIEEARQRLEDFYWSSPVPVRPGDPDAHAVRFTDVWDLELGGYDHHFLLACHAIQWGVRTYLAAHPGRLCPEVPRHG